MPKIHNEKMEHSQYRKRLRAAMLAKRDNVIKHSQVGEIRGLARTIGYSTNDSFFKEIDEHTRPKDAFLSGVLYANPVIINALGITLVVGATATLQEAFIISVISCILLLVINVLAATVFHRLHTFLRLPAYMLTASLILLPIGGLLAYSAPQLSSSLGIYLPLIAVCGLVVVRAESYAMTQKLSFAVADALGNGIGFSFICILVGAIREIIGSGTLGSLTLFQNVSFPAAHLSFFPFLILGIIAAIGQMIQISRRKNTTEPDAETEEKSK